MKNFSGVRSRASLRGEKVQRASTFFWRDAPDPGRKIRMELRINRSIADFSRGGFLAKEIPTLPVARWPDRSRRKSAAAIRAHITQYAVNTARAKRTLERTNARFQRVRRQGLVTVFTCRSEFKHSASPDNLTACATGAALTGKRIAAVAASHARTVISPAMKVIAPPLRITRAPAISHITSPPRLEIWRARSLFLPSLPDQYGASTQ